MLLTATIECQILEHVFGHEFLVYFHEEQQILFEMTQLHVLFYLTTFDELQASCWMWASHVWCQIKNLEKQNVSYIFNYLQSDMVSEIINPLS